MEWKINGANSHICSIERIEPINHLEPRHMITIRQYTMKGMI